ncbi:MAG: hypothetical protein EXQ97_01310 [Alphaproteobacteria bacterium]|nr:hypothetical protein [Alphaproteobacteria bacterium]
MRFLVDNALSPVVARSLCEGGHDAVHVRELGIQHATDEVIFARASADDRIVVSSDTYFGGLVLRQAYRPPSVILLRRGTDLRPQRQAALLTANLPTIEADLRTGCIVVIEEGRLRIRRLAEGRDC